MTKLLWEFDKFWVIWGSCSDRPRTIKDIQNIWGYEGNSLYQKGLRKPIWKEMIEQGFLERRGSMQKRGVAGVLLYGRMEWVPEFLNQFTKKIAGEMGYTLPLEIIECFPDSKKLIDFLETHRTTFFFIETVKTLFGSKENLKRNFEMILLSPLLVVLDIYMISILHEEMDFGEEMYFILSQPMIFNPSFSMNFIEYFKRIARDIKIKDIPEGLVSKSKAFSLWKRYAEELMREMG